MASNLGNELIRGSDIRGEQWYLFQVESQICECRDSVARKTAENLNYCKLSHFAFLRELTQCNVPPRRFLYFSVKFSSKRFDKSHR